MSQLLNVPEERREALRGVLAYLEGAARILLTTHVNADGDGAGSEAALAMWLMARGKQVRIANPTAYPEVYRYLLPEPSVVFDPGHRRGVAADVDLVAVLDTGETRRIGRIAPHLDGRHVVIVDHHPAGETAIRADAAVQETSACATGELIFDLLRLADGEADWPVGVAQALVSEKSRANYMADFRRYLEEEGVPGGIARGPPQHDRPYEMDRSEHALVIRIVGLEAKHRRENTTGREHGRPHQDRRDPRNEGADKPDGQDSEKEP